jgi:hypothetical protein
MLPREEPNTGKSELDNTRACREFARVRDVAERERNTGKSELDNTRACREFVRVRDQKMLNYDTEWKQKFKDEISDKQRNEFKRPGARKRGYSVIIIIIIIYLFI